MSHDTGAILELTLQCPPQIQPSCRGVRDDSMYTPPHCLHHVRRLIHRPNNDVLACFFAFLSESAQTLDPCLAESASRLTSRRRHSSATRILSKTPRNRSKSIFALWPCSYRGTICGNMAAAPLQRGGNAGARDPARAGEQVYAPSWDTTRLSCALTRRDGRGRSAA